eukprot:365655-Chlamydomonas_euryale.AAC.12
MKGWRQGREAGREGGREEGRNEGRDIEGRVKRAQDHVVQQDMARRPWLYSVICSSAHRPPLASSAAEQPVVPTHAQEPSVRLPLRKTVQQFMQPPTGVAVMSRPNARRTRGCCSRRRISWRTMSTSATRLFPPDVGAQYTRLLRSSPLSSAHACHGYRPCTPPAAYAPTTPACGTQSDSCKRSGRCDHATAQKWGGRQQGREGLGVCTGMCQFGLRGSPSHTAAGAACAATQCVAWVGADDMGVIASGKASVPGQNWCEGRELVQGVGIGVRGRSGCTPVCCTGLPAGELEGQQALRGGKAVFWK